MALQAERGVPLSTLCPKFLHSNSTSHTWPFSAIAELIDNAYDPDVCAKQFWIDKTVVKGEECLCFMDNGNGLDNQTMHKMLSFGYSDKTAVNGLEPIGIYGNGFKSGSMRLGKDAIVFSKSMNSSCVGMLSQTYLQKIEANQIIVPIICFEEREKNKRSVPDEYKASLQDILKYSPFKTEEELLAEIDAIAQQWSATKTGTRIIIWNLRRTSSGTTEFDFEKDRYDIRIPSEVYETLNDAAQNSDSAISHTPESVFSLRAYCSILYMKPRMQIVVRGVKVKTQLIAKSLAWRRKDHYKPTFLNNFRIPITFGYNTKSKDQYGIMMYHKNRLIKAYERVGCQLKANNKGVGVIGVIECNFLEPTHNKQNFLESDKYRKTMISLGNKLEEYWKEIRFRKSKENPNSTVPVEDTIKRPDQNWVQCDECSKWRKLPDGIDCTKLPNKWFCRMNPDPQFRSCDIEEEPEDSDDDQPSYRKTYREQEREDRRKLLDQQMAEERKRREAQRLADMSRKTEALQRRREELKRNLREMAISSPSTPMTPRSIAMRAESSPQSFSTLSQAACSPSSSLPVITDVRSLSTETQRKRTFPFTPQTPKHPQVNGFHRKTAVAPSSSTVPVVRIDDDADDDLVILENASTPKPQQAGPEKKKVKLEKDDSGVEISMLLECTDDAAVDDAPGAEGSDSAVGGASSLTNPSNMASITTQTEAPKVKQEALSQNSTEAEPMEAQNTGTKNVPAQRSDSDSRDFEEREFKQESEGDTPTEARGPPLLHNGVGSGEKAGPSHANADKEALYPAHFHSINEVQEQQDRLMELMQETAKERDALKEQVHQLTCQLEERSVKKECSHQASQTDAAEQRNYRSLLQRAKQKVDELIELSKDSEALRLTTDTEDSPTEAPGEADDTDGIALKVKSLIRRLAQTNKEKDELRSQVGSLTEEKTKLAAECEKLRSSLQQQSEEAPSTSGSSVPPPGEEAGQSDALRSLIQLRHNVGRYLVPHVPALDLEQVNFECSVIDEILEQLLSSP
ncbi:MORC family CW-type zinc finger protein 3a [Salarias fasciatus]|uniref:CW-type domain-containing protein n=1 Tax=Salarias fasciatus TaxID=181472 RepID=A0A672JTV3_SALFA|nr:MORC family CW-type zinc finger protein 3 [Salarias fasciatus]